MSIAERKSHELTQKIAAFGAGVDDWLKERRSQAGFKIHSSQLNAIEAILGGLRAGIDREFQAAVKDGSVLARAMSIEDMILSGYQIWEFYRPKLAQRLETPFQKYLRIADEFAWACYKPVRDAFFGSGPGAKEPPLVYLNAEWSPFLKERNLQYQVESVPGALLATQPDFRKAVARLPFPVIGVPWYQAGFLPGGLTIAHEVGHAVAADCELQSKLEAAMAAVKDAQRKKSWEAWADEMFADAFGCHCAGKAFAFSLADTLAADRATVNSAQEARYPPHSLRILLNCAMLRKLGHVSGADDLWKQWSDQYRPPYAWSAHQDDVDAVAGGLLAVPIRRTDGQDVTLEKLVSFPEEWDANVRQYAGDTKNGIAGKQVNMRAMWAAARLSYEDNTANFATAAKGQRSIAQKFVDRIRQACPDDFRAGEAAADKGRSKYLRALGEQFLVKEGVKEGG